MDFIKKLGKEVISNTTGINLGSSSGHDMTLYVTAIRAEGIKDKDRLTKSDPYLIVSLGSKSFRTKTVKNDLSPQWNETFTFKTSTGKSKDIHLKLKDDDYGIDDTIGTAVVSSADFPMYSGEEKYIQVPIKRHEEIHGIVHLRIKKFAEGQQSYSSANQTSSYSQPPSYSQNYSQSTQYQQQQQQAPPSYHQSSNQQYQQHQQHQQQAPYYGQPQYNQQQQGYPPAGAYSTSYPMGYNNNNNQQSQQSHQYPYQQYNQQQQQRQQGYNQQGYNQQGYNQQGYSQQGSNQGYYR